MRKYILVSLILALIISTIGCTQSDLENYTIAMDKTDNMSRGSAITEMSISNKINTDGMDEEVLKIIERFEDTKFSLKNNFDKEVSKSKAELYMFTGGFGYDMNVYKINDSFYIEPLFLSLKDKKYVEISEDEFLPVQDDELPLDLFEAFGEKWSEILKEENVMKGENVLISTEDGEVKSREFTIELNEEQLKELMTFIINELQKNDDYMEIMEEVVYFSDEENLTQEQKEELFNQIFEELKSFVLNADNMNLFYKAYIDIDGYVIQEDVVFTLENKEATSGEVEDLKYEMTNQYFNIEREQSLEFEVPTNEVIKFKDLDIERLFLQMGGK